LPHIPPPFLSREVEIREWWPAAGVGKVLAWKRAEGPWLVEASIGMGMG